MADDGRRELLGVAGLRRPDDGDGALARGGHARCSPSGEGPGQQAVDPHPHRGRHRRARGEDGRCGQRAPQLEGGDEAADVQALVVGQRRRADVDERGERAAAC